MTLINELRTAHISGDGKYRYELKRVWNKKLKRVVFIGLNPSTADGEQDDATIRRLRNFAKAWGYGGFVIINLFAYRSTNPRILVEEGYKHGREHIIGPRNKEYIFKYLHKTKYPIAMLMWGNNVPMRFIKYARQIADFWIPKAHYFKKTKEDNPAHPVRLSASLKPIKWV